ncbi:MAG: lipopolysaccharide export system ATP-binding protein [bacterium]|nr:MAG: lipopolysaccharide export system ATP-binding protein [bacterium]
MGKKTKKFSVEIVSNENKFDTPDLPATSAVSSLIEVEPIKTLRHLPVELVSKTPDKVPGLLRAEGLKKSYRGRCVVNEVEVEVRRGEIVGLLGPNGAGKTTSFYMIVGLEKPDAGHIHLGDGDITDLPMYLRARQGISYLPQEPSIFRKLTVEKNILAILETLELSRQERQERLEKLLEELDIVHVRHTRGYALSGGERRRTEIARCLTLKPYFILLDEPFAGIDPIAVLDIQKIVKRLKDSGIGVLITDHNVRETLAITDRAYIINNGG